MYVCVVCVCMCFLPVFVMCIYVNTCVCIVSFFVVSV